MLSAWPSRKTTSVCWPRSSVTATCSAAHGSAPRPVRLSRRAGRAPPDSTREPSRPEKLSAIAGPRRRLRTGSRERPIARATLHSNTAAPAAPRTPHRGKSAYAVCWSSRFDPSTHSANQVTVRRRLPGRIVAQPQRGRLSPDLPLPSSPTGTKTVSSWPMAWLLCSKTV